ncbi:MAG: rRNA maturation RNase YbeY [Treponema sp.]|nr:rRNA maturation RNase YbeY [Treponema sp.]
MNSVIINAQEIPLPSWSSAAVEFALNVLDEIKRDNWELSIVLCDDKTITAMNRQYRNKNEPTDVLSFNLGETIQDGNRTVYLPGDIVISLDSLKENSKYFQIPEDEELCRLIIHGILHLDGMDHSSSIGEGAKAENSGETMLELQEDILKKLKIKHIINLHGVKI